MLLAGSRLRSPGCLRLKFTRCRALHRARPSGRQLRARCWHRDRWNARRTQKLHSPKGGRAVPAATAAAHACWPQGASPFTLSKRQATLVYQEHSSMHAKLPRHASRLLAARRKSVAASARAPPTHRRPKLLPKLGTGEQQERPEQQQAPAALLAVRRQAESPVEGRGRCHPEACQWRRG